jgi:nucleotide-binding universal stress UspA family protein
MNFSRILVPVTLSKEQHCALAFALSLARKCRGTITLLHAVQLNIVGEERGIPRTQLVRLLCREAESELSRLADNIGTSIPIEVVVGEGRPAETIVEMANSLAADAIVLRTRGYRDGLKRLSRTTAARVVRHASCPVWLVSHDWQDKGLATVTFVDRPRHPGRTQLEDAHENACPFRSLLRGLFA